MCVRVCLCACRDDTLLCSSFLASRGLRLDSDPAKVAEFEGALTDLSHSIITLLKLALSYGPVTVITNAETGWVSAQAGERRPGWGGAV